MMKCRFFRWPSPPPGQAPDPFEQIPYEAVVNGTVGGGINRKPPGRRKAGSGKRPPRRRERPENETA